MLELVYLSILATVMVIILVVALRPIAIHLNIVDRPDDRKVHTGDIPLVGGPVIWLVVTLCVLLFIPNPPWFAMISAAVLVILGVVDDREPVPAAIKLVFHLAAATVIVIGENFVISNIGVLTEIYSLPEFSTLHTVVAILAITASINAFNMIDGIDGLSASMALLTLIHALISFNLIYGAAPSAYATFAFIFAGALAGFLMFNLQIFNGRKVFLGDSGSMLIGLTIAIALIGASQARNQFSEGHNIPPTLCLWLLAIPITDITVILVRRLAQGRSLLAPDRTHIHHKIMDAGFSPRRTLLVLTLSAVGAFWIGYFLTTKLNELISLICFILFVPSFFVLIQQICRFVSSRRN